MRDVVSHPITKAEKIAAVERAINALDDGESVGGITVPALRELIKDIEGRKVYKIVDYLRENVPAAYVTEGTSGVKIDRAVVYLMTLASDATRGNGGLYNDDMARLLIQHYGFGIGSETANAKEIDISMECKLYHRLGRPLPDLAELMNSEDLARPDIKKSVGHHSHNFID